MAHWAEIDNDNKVIRVLVGSNEDPDEGYQWLIDNLGGTWIKTSYNTVAGNHTQGGTPLRGNYAGVGFIYDEELDAFYAPQPFASWTLNHTTFTWDAPKAYPTDGKFYTWDEEDRNWIEVRDEA
jgi:hypothetical protein